MKNIGLFGGTFDPIHNGHLHIARAFADEIGLDLVVFLPAGDPYHKDSTRTPAQERLNMVELAIADEPKFAASDCRHRSRQAQLIRLTPSKSSASSFPARNCGG